MKIKVALFDLDGTLLRMNAEEFTNSYFSNIASWLEPFGYDKKELISVIWKGTAAMVKNGGEKTNESVFWDVFKSHYSDREVDESVFDSFYREGFDRVRLSCGFSPMSAKAIELLKEKGITVALATNPLFPSVATEKRCRWAGLVPEDFALITTYENSRFCKPNLDYYREIAKVLGVKEQECLMVGNDVDEDMIASSVGMRVFLLTDNVINRHGADVSAYPSGSFPELVEYINKNL